MTYLDEYQWRYRQPAPSLHEAFVEMAPITPGSGGARNSGGALSLCLQQPWYYWA
jgi:hypothetical protein